MNKQASTESVWDYPRPPRIEPSTHHIRIEFGGITLVDSRNTFRVLETSHPPVYYIPPTDIQVKYLEPDRRTTFCEWKGEAHYFSVSVDKKNADHAAWTYRNPTAAYAAIAGYLAFYPSKMDACWVDDELVTAQAGDFYGGWITSMIVGPFKGGPDIQGW